MKRQSTQQATTQRSHRDDKIEVTLGIIAHINLGVAGGGEYDVAIQAFDADVKLLCSECKASHWAIGFRSSSVAIA